MNFKVNLHQLELLLFGDKHLGLKGVLERHFPLCESPHIWAIYPHTYEIKHIFELNDSTLTGVSRKGTYEALHDFELELISFKKGDLILFK